MRESGVYDLGSTALTAALTGQVITSQADVQGATQAYLDQMEGLLAALLQINFVYGSGGTNCIVAIETSIDDGTTWIEVWRALFATASEENLVNLSVLTPLTTPYTPAALSNDASKDGILGNRWRAKVTSTGIYAGNTSIAIRMHARMPAR